MLIHQPLPFVQEFVAALDEALRAHDGAGRGLSRLQQRRLSFCLMAIVITNSLCWARFERVGLGRYSQAALSWVFCRAKLPWEWLLALSVRVILHRYGITGGTLVADDSDRERSKVTRRIAGVHKLKDKTSGGYVRGQCLVFLLSVTATATFPVGVAFYQPDPVLRAWRRRDDELKRQKIAQRARPVAPARDPAYPTKSELCLKLLERFAREHPTVQVKAVLVDALYGAQAFLEQASALFGGVQVISQLRHNQKVRFRNRSLTLETYFIRYPGVAQRYPRRGDEPVDVIIGSARLWVEAHGRKQLIVAVKYAGETEYRYLVATDLSWRTEDVFRTFTLRWLVEVFIQDWKGHEGWGTLAKQPGVEGSSHGLILSLLVDHCLLLHPAQHARLKNRQPAATVGSLIERIKVESLLDVCRHLIESPHPEQQLQHLAETLAAYCDLRPSGKHMVGRDWGRMEPTPALKYRAAACAAAS